MSENPQNEIYNIVQCCGCKKYLEKDTRKIVQKPGEGIVASHTYCPECEAKAYEELEAQAAKFASMHRIMANSGVRYGVLHRRKTEEIMEGAGQETD